MFRKVGLFLLVGASLSLAGCGGGSSTSGGGSGSGGSGSGGGSAPVIPDGLYTAHVHVVVGGAVTVTPVTGATRSILSGNAATILASNTIYHSPNPPGSGNVEIGINFQVTNNLGYKIGTDGQTTGGVNLAYNFLNSTGAKFQELGSNVQFLAGTGTAGYLDGQPHAAEFNGLNSIAPYLDTWFLVSDTNNNRLRVISPGNANTTSLGTGVAGDVDGLASTASFNQPFGLCSTGSFDSFSEIAGNRIRQVIYTYSGPTAIPSIRTLAGTGQIGRANGNGTSSTFNHPHGIATAVNGLDIYVADTDNNLIRKLTFVNNIGIGTYTVSTYSGSGTAGLKDGSASTAQFNHPTGITTDDDGNVYVADTGNSAIRMILSDGSVTTIAGLAGSGFQDGTGDVSQFNHPQGISASTRNGGFPFAPLLYVADTGNNVIRQIQFVGNSTPQLSPIHIENLANWQVITIAGSPGMPGAQAGAGNLPNFTSPVGILAPSPGTGAVMQICDSGTNEVSQLTSTIPVAQIEPTFENAVNLPLSTATVNNYLQSQRYVGRTLPGSLAPGVTSGTDEWRFSVPPGVTSFDFTITVSAKTNPGSPLDLPSESGTGTGSPQVQFTYGPDITVGESSPPGGTNSSSAAQFLLPDGSFFLSRSYKAGQPPYSYDTNFLSYFDSSSVEHNLATFSSFNSGTSTGLGDVGSVLSGCQAANGQVYLGTQTNILVLTPTGADKTTAAGWTVVKLGSSSASAGTDGDGNTAEASANLITEAGGVIYFVEGSTLRKIVRSGSDLSNPANYKIVTIATYNSFSGAQIGNQYFGGLCASQDGHLIVSDTGRRAIYELDSNGGVLRTVGGRSGGWIDGDSSTCAFLEPYGVTCNANGTIYVDDFYNQFGHHLREISTNGAVSTAVGSGHNNPSGFVGDSENWSGSGMIALPNGDLLSFSTSNAPFAQVLEADRTMTTSVYIAK